jgi:hypothetical protein
MQVVWKALGTRGGGGPAALLEGCIRAGMGHTVLSGGAVSAVHEDASADHLARSVCLKVGLPPFSLAFDRVPHVPRNTLSRMFSIFKICP